MHRDEIDIGSDSIDFIISGGVIHSYQDCYLNI